jgi:hypothetical protein
MSDIDEQAEDVRGKGRGHHRTDSGSSGRRIQEALVIAAIIALIGSVWNLSQTMAVLKASQDFQQRQLDRVQTRQDALEGRITRGGPHALDQQ